MIPTVIYDIDIIYRPPGGSTVFCLSGAGFENPIKPLYYRMFRRCREFGFPIEAARSLVVVLHNPQSSCMEARELAQQHLVGVR
jgi:hypothetical protein